MARRLRYQVAVSLDGFIADPNGGYDWIVMDPAIDFAAMYAQFDAVVMGRKTFEVTMKGGAEYMPPVPVTVFSRSLPAEQRGNITVTSADPATTIAAMKQQPGRDIWLFGGGELFRSLLNAGLVDTVELALMPVLLGSGIPVVPPGPRARLELADRKILRGSGIVVLSYKVSGSPAATPRIEYVKGGE